MGGKGSGGRRKGSGRKKKTDAERFIDGNAGHRGKVLAHPSVPPVVAPLEIDEFDAPDNLNFEERNVWLRLAPFGFKNGTLTKASALSFEILCRNIALEQQYAQSVMDKGSANHRGILQKVEAGLDAFMLRPTGKPMPGAVEAKPEPQKAASYW